MGLIENFGRVASSYMEEKEQLQEVAGKRNRLERATGFGRMKCCVTPFSCRLWQRCCCFTLG